jgi:iron(II)-dependent oxidoreductase
MSFSLNSLARLRGIHKRLRSLVEPLSDEELRQQYHIDLSPVGWHLGHSCFIENYWIREVVQENDQLTRGLHELYFPELSPKPERGGKLPAKGVLLAQTQEQHEQNLLLLSGMAEPLKDNPLLKDEYLVHFLIQHHAQHYETMLMILTQRAYSLHRNQYHPGQRLLSAPPSEDYVELPECTYPIGGEWPMAFDNELPAHAPELEAFSIRRTPVSNAEYLGFMDAGGYEQQEYWSEDGWKWKSEQKAAHPEHWRQDDRGWWYALTENGPADLDGSDPVYGINYYEAEAFAHYAGAELPDEHQWEAAHKLHALQQTGMSWEWCRNHFAPYEGYVVFPYAGYSSTWFDGKHFVLKGGSRYTRPVIKRPSFRNFYNPDKRHIFAGCRLSRQPN